MVERSSESAPAFATYKSTRTGPLLHDEIKYPDGSVKGTFVYDEHYGRNGSNGTKPLDESRIVGVAYRINDSPEGRTMHIGRTDIKITGVSLAFSDEQRLSASGIPRLLVNIINDSSLRLDCEDYSLKRSIGSLRNEESSNGKLGIRT